MPQLRRLDRPHHCQQSKKESGCPRVPDRYGTLRRSSLSGARVPSPMGRRLGLLRPPTSLVRSRPRLDSDLNDKGSRIVRGICISDHTKPLEKPSGNFSVSYMHAVGFALKSRMAKRPCLSDPTTCWDAASQLHSERHAPNHPPPRWNS